MLAAVLALLFHLQQSHPGQNCASAIGFHFYGEPGTRFRYGAAEYVIPRWGSVEIVSDGAVGRTFRANGRELPVAIWPLNEFGFREVPVSERR